MKKVISHATKNPVICSTVIDDMDAGIGEFINVVVDQAMAATIQQPQIGVTDFCFAASKETDLVFLTINK